MELNNKRIQDLRAKWHENSTPQDNSNTPAPSAPRSTAFVECAAANVIVKRFTLHKRNGHRLAIHYASLPLFEQDVEGRLNIISHSYKITIEGRNLGKVMEYLSTECLLRISESKTGMDTADAQEVFVSDIQFTGNAFE